MESSVFRMPFAPYQVQQQAADLISQQLNSSSRSHPVVAIELPTGCGKTLTLLTSALQFQEYIKSLGTGAGESFLLDRSPAEWAQARRRSRRCSNTDALKKKPKRIPKQAEGEEEGVDEWAPPALFFQQFRPVTAPQKRLRTELAEAAGQINGLGAPPTTIFFVARTHAQLAQAARELRKLPVGSKSLKMNVMSSREHTCINQRVRRDVTRGTLPIEGNNLGEVCDKLVALGQCQMVQRFSELAGRAISRPIGKSSTMVWEIEDLVAEGAVMEGCPYYAARELVFHADVTFATYNYLLDPVIRKETKFEAALKNHSIVIFDEAHNVPDVCRDALSHAFTNTQLLMMIDEVRPLVEDFGPGGFSLHPQAASLDPQASQQQQRVGGTSAFVPTYPRQFCITQWTLVELFQFFLESVLLPLLRWLEISVDASSSCNGSTFQQQRGDDWMKLVFGQSFLTDDMIQWIPKFKQIYGVIMSLGVTFNPFQFSIHTLGITKRLLTILRFMALKPRGFAIWREAAAEDQSLVDSAEDCRSNATQIQHHVKRFMMRCCDSSLAFTHLSSVCYAVIAASGTLAPFDQLAEDLGIDGGSENLPLVEGNHVINLTEQCRVEVVTHCSHSRSASTCIARPLRCTYGNFQSAEFVDHITQCIVDLTSAAKDGGGSLVFLPNYKLMNHIASLFQVLQQQQQQQQQACGSDADKEKRRTATVQIFKEPSRSDMLPSVLSEFKNCTVKRRAAVLFGVYRGKLSEGIDFIDSMARLVICVGLPFQPTTSPAVFAQKAFSGEKWYVADAVRTVNQALGRCIRHKNDFGAIVLLDDRYSAQATGTVGHLLSRWCRSIVRSFSSSMDCANDLRSFFSRFQHPTDVPQLLQPPHAQAGELRDGELAGIGKQISRPIARAEPFARLCPHRTNASAGITQIALQEHNARCLFTEDARQIREEKSKKQLQSGWFSVAQKLLCEQADDAALLSRESIENLGCELQQYSMIVE